MRPGLAGNPSRPQPEPPHERRRPRTATLGRAGEGVAVVALYSAAAAWWLWPLPSAWSDHSAYFWDHLPTAVADYYFLVWTFVWGVRALLHQPLHPFDANAFHPTPLALALSDHCFGYLPLFAPAYLVTGNPVLSANLVLLAGFPLCAGAAYALARRWVHPAAALVCGFLYAFYPLRLESIVHFHQLGVMYIPLLPLFAERWLDHGRRRDAMAFGVCLTLQALSSFYIAYTTLLALSVYLPAALWRRRHSVDLRRLAGLAAALVLALLPVVAAALPYVRLRHLGLLPSYGESDAPVALGLLPPFSTLRALRMLAQDGTPLVGYALGLAALVAPPRELRWPTGLGLLLAAAGVLMSFGPAIQIGSFELWSPYQLFALLVPGMSTVRLPSRFYVVAQLGFALLAALGVMRLASLAPRRLRAAAASGVAAAALLLVVRGYAALPAPTLHREVAPPHVPALYEWLARHGEGRPLLELPPSYLMPAAQRMFLSAYHGLPIVDGYSSYWSRSPEIVHRLARSLPSEESLQRLVDWVDVGWVLVDLAALPESERERWRGPLPDGLEPAGAPPDRDRLLFRITRPPRDDRRARLLSTSETPEGAPLRRLDGPCPGELRLVVPPPDPWPAGSDAAIVVEAANAGEAAWPADGIFPRYLVEGRAELRDASRARTAAARLPFAQDIAPGGSARARAVLRAPWEAGDYELRAWLVQDRGFSLEECGVAPLRVPVAVR